VAKRLAALVVDQIVGSPLDELGTAIELTEPLKRHVTPSLITFSGGVAEYIFGYENAEYGDIAKSLATEVGIQLGLRCQIPVVDPGHRIRATVIGASQFTVQVSGKTIFLPSAEVLPVRNIPVVHIASDCAQDPDSDGISQLIASKLDSADLAPHSTFAIAFGWRGEPDYARLRAVGEGIAGVIARGRGPDNLCFLMIDGDVGATFGKLLKQELEFPGHLIAIDGVQLRDFDFVDIGSMISPPGVIPMVIKSLLFS
jgi:ethanolamine utilization protein EutA